MRMNPLTNEDLTKLEKLFKGPVWVEYEYVGPRIRRLIAEVRRRRKDANHAEGWGTHKP